MATGRTRATSAFGAVAAVRHAGKVRIAIDVGFGINLCFSEAEDASLVAGDLGKDERATEEEALALKLEGPGALAYAHVVPEGEVGLEFARGAVGQDKESAGAGGRSIANELPDSRRLIIE